MCASGFEGAIAHDPWWAGCYTCADFAMGSNAYRTIRVHQRPSAVDNRSFPAIGLLHPIGEEPAEACVEPVLELAEAVHDPVDGGAHACNNSNAMPIGMRAEGKHGERCHVIR